MISTAMLPRKLSINLQLALTCLIAASCAQTPPPTPGGVTADVSESSSAASSENSYTTLSRSIETQSPGRVLASPGTSAVGLEVFGGKNSNVLVVRPDKLSGAFKVSRLSAPDRIVLDLPGARNPSNKEFAANMGLVNKIRVGAHPDKIRIVLDLSGNEYLAHEAKKNSDGSISLVVAREGFMEQALNTKLGGKAPQKVLAAESLAPAGTTAEAEHVKENQESLTERTKLTKLSIQSLGEGGNALIADMAEISEYSLKKTAPSEYVLRIKNSSLDSGAIATVLAPPAGGKIRSARPVSEGSDVLVRIFAAPDAELQAASRAGKILVRDSSAQDSDSMRAQFAPPAEEKTAEGAAKKDAAEKSAAVKTPEVKEPEIDSEVSSLLVDIPKYTGRLISLDLQDTDIDNALRIIAEVSNLNIIASDKVTGKVTLRLIDVPWDQALDVILKTNGLDKVQEGNVIRIAPVEDLRAEREALKQAQAAEEELEPLTVRYIRISYAKAADLKPLVETVLSERGSVSYDERSNQLIVKDISKGVKNVAELVTKLDLRTPQVLLETEIVEARRNILRDLGNELGFQFIQSPATGNATHWNFPNSVSVGGSAAPGNTGSNFPAAIGAASGSAVSILLGSADGSATLSARLSSLEEEGRIRVVSRPAVATTNNTKAQIKSVEKIRVKTPSGGLSVATGTGASNSANSGVATETIEIGITLDVTPQASPDYYVLLDINAKSSTFGSRQVEGIPSEVERAATSTVLVSSGQTFAMGGIYKITDNNSISGVPFLKDIPVLGHLFRRDKVDNADEELVFFITPRIIEGSFDDAAMRSAL